MPQPRRTPLLMAAFLALGTVIPVRPAHALERPVVLSVYQGPIREGDFQANLAQTRAVISRARDRGSQFLAFPECFLSGYESQAAVQSGARGLDDPDLAAFIHETAEHDLVIMLGLARREGNRLFNSVLVIQNGQLLGVHDKAMLTPDDRNVLGFSPGNAVPVFTAHGARFAVLICADTSHLPPAQLAVQQGAEILFTPHYNEIAQPQVDDHRRWVRNCHVGLASQLRVAVARANVVKSSRPGQVGYGDSFVLSPQGEPLAEARLFRAELITATLTPDHFRPPHVWANSNDTPTWLRTQMARQLAAFRTPSHEADLRFWLENMLVHHRYTTSEASAATGLTPAEVSAAAQRLGVATLRPQPQPPGSVLRVLPYPGGRHPRLGFFDGAVAPQRETKVSVFPPWEGGGYVVVDVPEAVFSNLGLIYLAHTHIPTFWDQRGVTLPPVEWQRLAGGRLTGYRLLPNGVAFEVQVHPRPEGVHFSLSLKNGTPEPLSGLRIQNCVMLGRADGFTIQSTTNKVFSPPFAAARSADGRHWVITGWERCQRSWGNPWVPCIHADPVLADCPPNDTVEVRGWLSFFEGAEIGPELDRLRTLGVLERPPSPPPE